MNLYICGDSFCCNDFEYPGNWAELLTATAKVNVVNLASPAASNYLIYLQVKHALEQQCDYLIYNATSSIRHEFVLRKNFDQQDHFARYWNLSKPNSDCSMVSISWPNPQNTASRLFDKQTIKSHSDYFNQHIDLPSLIEKNYIFIQHTLHLLSNSKIKWAWNRGGFEHKNFGGTSDYDFSKWNKNESKINLWDYYNNTVTRPYYHITDKKVLQDTCDQYINMLQL